MSHLSRRVVVRSGGEMGSGVAWRLSRCGFDVIITEIAQPTAIRRWVCFSEAVYDGEQTVDGIRALRVDSPDNVEKVWSEGAIPVLVSPDRDALPGLRPGVIVDAILAKRPTGNLRRLAELSIGLGPGFEAGSEVDCVIETNRGPDLGRCIRQGSAEAHTGVPGLLGGETIKRVLRAPREGVVESVKTIGDLVSAGDIVARVGGMEVCSQLDGVVRGLIREGIQVSEGRKIGDVDPRGDITICRRISDKALAIAGGVTEAILAGRRERT